MADIATSDPQVSAIVLAHGPEPHLEDCVRALVASTGTRVEVVVVDNEANPAAVAHIESLPGVRVLRPGTNTGFAGGCNLAARAATAPVLAFVNSDAVVEPGCLAALAATLAEPGIGLACASLRLARDPEVVNSVGNPVHFLYFSWVGGYGEPASQHTEPGPVASITGATFATRRDTWERTGGFDEHYFLYGEDVDLSVRTWQGGQSVVFVPGAVSVHHYDFHRTARKYYYLERNRLLNLLTLTDRRTLLRVLPMAAGVEVAIMIRSLAGGTLREKTQGYAWLVAHRDYVRQRRTRVQAQRVDDPVVTNEMLVGRLDIPEGFGIRAPQLADRALAAGWRWARRPPRPARVQDRRTRRAGRARRSLRELGLQ